MTNLETSSFSRRKLLTPLAHFLFIIILFVLPELVMAIAMPHKYGINFYPGFYVKTLIYIAAFYLNYLLLVDRTLGRSDGNRRIINFLLWNLLIIAAGLLLSYLLSVWTAPPTPSPRRRHMPPEFGPRFFKQATFLVRDGVMLILTIGLAVALRLSTKWKDIERRHQEIVAEQRTIELTNLKSQLNPHFLFNTLNTIYALVDIEPDNAKKAVHRLSALLRYMLYEDVTAVPLRREVDFIEDYVSLMRLRISGRDINVEIDLAGNDDAEVPPLLFIPLIENAFKYGTSVEDDTPITISIKVIDNNIVCTTCNSFAHQPSHYDDEHKASGIGLANLRRRLLLIYGNKASLRTSANENIYKAKLLLPI